MNNYAVIFPGQGSQQLGMLADIPEQYPLVLKIFSEASEVLGYDLWRLCQEGPEEILNQTEFTQPALLAASTAIWQVLKNHLPTPRVLAGHSLGEYSALVCAESIPFADAIQLVQYRGQLMQRASPKEIGAMAAIAGLEDEAIDHLCKELSKNNTEKIVPANFNASGQCVIAGHRKLIEKAVLIAKERGAKLSKILPVSVAAHSFFMTEATKDFAVALRKIIIKTPNIPILCNVTADTCQDSDYIREQLIKQLDHPVRWTEIQKKIAQLGVSSILEVGSGKILSGLAKRTIPEVSCVPVNHLEDILKVFQVSG